MSTRDRDGRGRTGVQVIERASAILGALRGEAEGLTLTQLSVRVGVARSTVHRIVLALEKERLVVAASPSGGYRLGPAVACLGASVGVGGTRELRTFLERLARETQETVDLAVLSHDQVVFIDQVAGGHRLRAISAVGEMFPAYCTANGKALLAQQPDEYLRWVLPDELPRMTPNTITSREQLLEELGEVRRSGLATDRAEHSEGICAVGTVVPTENGGIAALTVVLPAQRFDDSEETVAAALLRVRADIGNYRQALVAKGAAHAA
jgi:DNA-binding IclR family transcriptional regulator